MNDTAWTETLHAANNQSSLIDHPLFLSLLIGVLALVVLALASSIVTTLASTMSAPAPRTPSRRSYIH